MVQSGEQSLLQNKFISSKISVIDIQNNRYQNYHALKTKNKFLNIIPEIQ